MTLFWLMAAAMVLAALGFVALPLLRFSGTDMPWRKWLPVALLVFLLPVAAALMYLKLGNPLAMLPAGHPSKAMDLDLSQLADRLAAKMLSQPNNAEGWVLLAHTYVELNRYTDAVPAFEKAAALLPRDAGLLADYADALAMAQGQRLEGKPAELAARALELDPENRKALLLAGSIAYERGEYQQAIAYWEKLQMGLTQEDAELGKEVAASIGEAKMQLNKAKPIK
jgi:cytochrome c-type biogenesis protein CcmH